VRNAPDIVCNLVRSRHLGSFQQQRRSIGGTRGSLWAASMAAHGLQRNGKVAKCQEVRICALLIITRNIKASLGAGARGLRCCVGPNNLLRACR